MPGRFDGSEDLERAAEALGRRPEARGPASYEISSALAQPAKRKLLGRWEVYEHHIGDRPFLELFCAQQLKGAELSDGLYQASYEFRDSLCIKKVLIDGLLPSDEGGVPYEYRLTVALSWRPGQGKSLVVRPEIGYQLTLLDGKPLACKDLPATGEEQRIAWRLEGADLVLEEAEDRRLLRRADS